MILVDIGKTISYLRHGHSARTSLLPSIQHHQRTKIDWIIFYLYMCYSAHLQYSQNLFLAHQRIRTRSPRSSHTHGHHSGTIQIIKLLLLKQCVEVSDTAVSKSEGWKRFWRWETYEEYSTYWCHSVKFILGLVAIMTVVTLFVQIFSFGYLG